MGNLSRGEDNAPCECRGQMVYLYMGWHPDNGHETPLQGSVIINHPHICQLFLTLTTKLMHHNS